MVAPQFTIDVMFGGEKPCQLTGGMKNYNVTAGIRTCGLPNSMKHGYGSPTLSLPVGYHLLLIENCLYLNKLASPAKVRSLSYATISFFEVTGVNIYSPSTGILM